MSSKHSNLTCPQFHERHCEKRSASLPLRDAPNQREKCGVLMNLLRRSRLFALAFAAAFILALPVVGAASASTTAPTGAASYNGSTIYLSQGWQGAHACGVFSPTDIECFDTSVELSAAIALHQLSGVSPDTGCGSGILYLFQDINFGGNELTLSSPQGLWINIDDYGFGNETSSWINTLSCESLAAKSTNGSGSQLAMGANSSSTWVGSAWNDAINSVQLG